MQNKVTVAVLGTLLFLAGVGFVLKGAFKPGNTSAPALTVNNSVEAQLKTRRALFQPIEPVTVAIENTRSHPAPAAVPVEKNPSTDSVISVPASELPDALPVRKLLQGNQHKQRATQFIKIGFDGQILPGTALRWSCARDTRTGLLWETKLFDAGISDVEHRYSWHDPTRSTPGFKNQGSCYGINCDTHAYTEEINRLGLCGSGSWRLPTFAELETLLDRDYFNPVINQEIFFNTRGASYWTQSQLENNPELIMQIDFFNGTSSPAPIHIKLAVRLVSK